MTDTPTISIGPDWDLSGDAAYTVTDGASPAAVLSAVHACAMAWKADVRVVGNVRAGDIVRAVRAIAAEKEAQAAPPGEPFRFTYRNHRGEVAERTVLPKSVRFGSTEWHPEPQWLLLAYDPDKGADREFAMRDIQRVYRPGESLGGGLVAVPEEPLPEMLAAWYRYKNGHHFHDEPPPGDTSDYGAYRAMLAALTEKGERS